jgi:hypothetical protein
MGKPRPCRPSWRPTNEQLSALARLLLLSARRPDTGQQGPRPGPARVARGNQGGSRS